MLATQTPRVRDKIERIGPANTKSEDVCVLALLFSKWGGVGWVCTRIPSGLALIPRPPYSVGDAMKLTLLPIGSIKPVRGI